MLAAVLGGLALAGTAHAAGRMGEGDPIEKLAKLSIEELADVRVTTVSRREESLNELNSSLTWRVSERIALALVGRNLLHDRHLEQPSGQGYAVPRSVFAEVRLGF